MKPLWWVNLHYKFHGPGGEHTEWIYCGAWDPSRFDMEDMAQSMSDSICGPGGWTCTETLVAHENVPPDIVRRKIRQVADEVEAGNRTLRELRGE